MTISAHLEDHAGARTRTHGNQAIHWYLSGNLIFRQIHPPQTCLPSDFWKDAACLEMRKPGRLFPAVSENISAQHLCFVQLPLVNPFIKKFNYFYQGYFIHDRQRWCEGAVKAGVLCFWPNNWATLALPGEWSSQNHDKATCNSSMSNQ